MKYFIQKYSLFEKKSILPNKWHIIFEKEGSLFTTGKRQWPNTDCIISLRWSSKISYHMILKRSEKRYHQVILKEISSGNLERDFISWPWKKSHKVTLKEILPGDLERDLIRLHWKRSEKRSHQVTLILINV